MSIVGSGAAAAPQSFLRALLPQVSGVAILGSVGTLIGAYFQNLSAYEEKVSNQAKDDMTAASATFTEASNAMSSAMTLQALLYFQFNQAIKLKSANNDKPDQSGNDKPKQTSNEQTLPSKQGLDLFTRYQTAFAALHSDINLLARKAEIYLDWASDKDYDPATNTAISVDPLSSSSLGAYNFDCDIQMPPKTDAGPFKLEVTDPGQTTPLDIDWRSAKHQMLTVEYCINVTHKNWMGVVLQWASQSPLDEQTTNNFLKDTAGKLSDRLDKNVERLNAFMSLAMHDIEKIRVKYRPNGYLCSVPIARGALGNTCTPLRIADQTPTAPKSPP
jgi:hypothetical protein